MSTRRFLAALTAIAILALTTGLSMVSIASANSTQSASAAQAAPEIPKRIRSCPSVSRTAQKNHQYGTNWNTKTRVVGKQCRPGDTVYIIKVVTKVTSGDCTAWGTRVRSMKISIDDIGNWNPANYTMKAHKDKCTYKRTQRPPGGQTAILPNSPRADKCWNTHTKLDIVLKGDQSYSTPERCFLA